MTGDTPILEARDVRKTYRMGRVRVPVLRGADVRIRTGEWVAVLGASGSGKSTLLHLLGGLDRPDRGDGESGVFFRGEPLATMPPRRLDAYRSESVGFVFQFYHLLSELNVMENVLLGAMIRHGRLGFLKHRNELRAEARLLLESFGLGERLRHRPAELSGGERQRVAIARAMINRPEALLADEPTGNLDQETGGAILDAIASLRGRLDQTIVMVTHDPAVADRADRTVRLQDGRIDVQASETAV